jgi:hypothetical protein
MKSSKALLGSAFVMLVLAGVFFYLSSIQLCRACTGWDTVNPLCLSQYAGCTAMETLADTGLVILALCCLLGMAVLVGIFVMQEVLE